jgi:hypothetical protein
MSGCFLLLLGYYEPMLLARTHGFNSRKVTQAACLILQLRGGTMSYLKLLKLLYECDREALRKLGRHISGDRHVSMDHGPVLSGTYQLIGDPPEDTASSFWHQNISPPHSDYLVSKCGDPGDDDLSEAEIDVIKGVFKELGHWNRWALVKRMHAYPEWHDPDGSSLPIPISDILQAVEVDAELAKRIDQEIQEKQAIKALFK